MYLSSTITLIIAHLRGAALRSEHIGRRTLGPSYCFNEGAPAAAASRCTSRPLIAGLRACARTSFLSSHLGEKKKKEKNLATLNIMSQEMVTCETTGSWF